MAAKNVDVIMDQFNEFYECDWNSQHMYNPSDFTKIFGITRHLARYYLMNLVREHRLFRVKYENKTFYGKAEPFAISRFNEYIWIGVEVTR